MWYHSGEFFDEPLKARELEIKKLKSSLQYDYISESEKSEISNTIRILEEIPDEMVEVCSVCYAVYDKRLHYSTCGNSGCFNNKFM